MNTSYLLVLGVLLSAGFAEARKDGELILRKDGDSVCSNKLWALKKNLPPEMAAQVGGFLDKRLEEGRKVYHRGILYGRAMTIPGDDRPGKTLDVNIWNMGCLDNLKTCPTKRTSGPSEILVGVRGTIQYHDRKTKSSREMIVCVNKKTMVPVTFTFHQPAAGKTLRVHTVLGMGEKGLEKKTTLAEIGRPRNTMVLDKSPVDMSKLMPTAPPAEERAPAAAEPEQQEPVPEPAVS